VQGAPLLQRAYFIYLFKSNNVADIQRELLFLPQVMGNEEEKSRLILCHATALTLRRALYILGIEPLYRL
jgi:hypothetical protein